MQYAPENSYVKPKTWAGIRRADAEQRRKNLEISWENIWLQSSDILHNHIWWKQINHNRILNFH